jgi:hypothetical protein
MAHPRRRALILSGLIAAALILPAGGARAQRPAPAPAAMAPAMETPAAEAPKPVTPKSAESEAALARLDRLEELLWRLTPDVDQLDTSIQNLELPDGFSRRFFDEQVAVIDLDAWSAPPVTPSAPMVQSDKWPIAAAAQPVKPEALHLWRPFLDAVDYLTQAHFKMVKGRFLDAAEGRYSADISFTGVARLKTGSTAAVSANLELTWIKYIVRGQGAPIWRIADWKTKSLSLTQTAGLLFAEVLDDALPDAADRARARRSLHEEMVVRQLSDPKAKKPDKYFQFESLNQHPGLAVVDLDGDGWDDLYVMERRGTNLLLRNRGDGTFEEIAAKAGLDITDHTSCALFADFDNDGDRDVFLGRTLAPSLYLVNEGGRFVDRSGTLVGAPLPALVSSISAVDYDNDGLLDVYFSTYGIDEDLQRDFLPAAAFKEIQDRWRDGAHMFRNRPGPPNVLMHNLGGGRFGVAPHSEAVAVWRNTFQSTWSDFDGDGDMDVYLANDFAPNNLIRNDGDGRFVDVTDKTGTADLGFGMGASWGDYDNDGREDLYVTNMYSTAGRRITEELGPLAAEAAPMARGNSLFRNAGERFVKVSGLEPPALTVEKAGWGWGGQFMDADNDGFLDIYALSGYYTAPQLPGSHPDL